LLSLVNKDSDGRIIISRYSSTSLRKQGQGGYIKYVMLSAEKVFSEVCLNQKELYSACVLPYKL
jgi:chromosome transmission fidelity protein 1